MGSTKESPGLVPDELWEESNSWAEEVEKARARGAILDAEMRALKEAMGHTKDAMDALRDDMRADEDSMKKVKAEFSLLKPFRNQVLRSREALLDDPSAISSGTLAGLSCCIGAPPHAGDIMVDLWVIDETVSDGRGDRLTGRKNVFERLYRVTYDWKDEIRNAPEDIIETFNIRANVSELDMWQTGEAAVIAKMIKPECEKILREWEQWVRDGKKREVPDTGEEFMNMKEKYREIWLREVGF